MDRLPSKVDRAEQAPVLTGNAAAQYQPAPVDGEALRNPMMMGQLYGDVPALLLIAIVLGYLPALMPENVTGAGHPVKYKRNAEAPGGDQHKARRRALGPARLGLRLSDAGEIVLRVPVPAHACRIADTR